MAGKTDLTEFLEADDPLIEPLRAALKGKRKYRVESLADDFDVSPKRIRATLQRMRDAGFRIPQEINGHVELVRIPPTSSQITPLPLELLSGQHVRFGVVSDTHLCSKECALDQLHLAYDHFANLDISRVLHAGDLVAGLGIFPTQHNELTHHTFEDQRDFAIEQYPRRQGITTYMIAGNHDLEGGFGKIGADPVMGFANQRDDVVYLGPYSAWLELANGAYVHLLHGKGGMSYAYSYKMQKLCDAYAPGRKPAALILGHFHVQGNLQSRGIQGMFPGCFEWSSKQFGDRLGLTPAVGFHVVDAQLGDDGSIVEWLPRWKPIWQGRVLA